MSTEAATTALVESLLQGSRKIIVIVNHEPCVTVDDYCNNDNPCSKLTPNDTYTYNCIVILKLFYA